MSLLVGFAVETEGLRTVRPVGHDRLGATPFKPLPQFDAVVSLVTEKPLGGLGAPDEARGGRTVVRLATTQQDGKKTSFSIRQCVDLRIAPAS